MFRDDTAAVMTGDRGHWSGNHQSSEESYDCEISEEEEEEEEELAREEQERKRNRYLSIPAGYTDSVSDADEYRGPSSDLLNSYMEGIYMT